jgi:predicted ATPase/DNA-binding CsgD family transcriptional regulator/tetratricopeptide (TPR) repeat protein
MDIRSRLPVGVSAFVGRERERAKAADLVMDARVVTLTGSGGCGKTRLAVEVAGDVASRFPDGAYWVDLQGVSEPELVAPIVGGAVGVRERPGPALIDTLAERLRARHLLLVLDNCEHVVGACAELVGALSSACPRLRVLATSRVPLVVEGEATFDVAGLPVPGPGVGSVSTVAATDAARLFEVRARQVDENFRISVENAPAVAEICRHLDGIPLAIGLAAARVPVLAPDQIAAGLSDRFGLLTGGVRGAPARQRTLEASLDWSHDLLDDTQRLALARLSVFAGSFELDAAEAVMVGEGIAGDDVLDLVAGLVEHSLVQVARRRGRARYRLLETIRAYAWRRLSELDAPDRVRDRHLEFHVGLAGRARASLTGGRPEPCVARLTADLDDLRAAMGWAVERGDLRSLVGLTEPIVRFWFDHGLSGEAHRRLHDAASTLGVPDDERARAFVTAAGLAMSGGESAGFHRSACQAVDAARAADEAGALAVGFAQRALSGLLSGLSTDRRVDSDIEQATRYTGRCEDAWTRSHGFQFAGAALVLGRSIDAAYRLFQQSVEVCEANDLTFQLPAAHAGHLAWSVWSGRLDRTRRHAHRAVELSRRVGRPGWEAAGLTGLGAAAVLQGDLDRARQWMSEAQDVLRPWALEASLYGSWVRNWRALLSYASDDLDTARTTAEEIVRVGRRGGSRWDESFGEWLLGVFAQDRGDHGDARTHWEAARALSIAPRFPHVLGRSLLGLAELAGRDEDLDQAWELTHDGLEILNDYGDRVGAAGALEQVAELAVALDEPERAIRLLAAAQLFLSDTGIVRFPLRADRFDHVRDTARAALDPTTALACWDEGSGLSLSDAIAYARRGRGERGRPRSGWASLTPVERDVVRLVARGRTNAEIGQRLFISVNTVKKHLSHVYAKVDAGGRAGLAAQVARHDL